MLNELQPESKQKQVSIFSTTIAARPMHVPAILTNAMISGALSTGQRNYSKTFTDDVRTSCADICIISTTTKTL